MLLHDEKPLAAPPCFLASRIFKQGVRNILDIFDALGIGLSQPDLMDRFWLINAGKWSLILGSLIVDQHLIYVIIPLPKDPFCSKPKSLKTSCLTSPSPSQRSRPSAVIFPQTSFWVINSSGMLSFYQHGSLTRQKNFILSRKEDIILFFTCLLQITTLFMGRQNRTLR